MTKIEYKPHCGKCGALIDEEISYRNIIVEGRLINPSGIVIEPYRCKNCGELFNIIEVAPPNKKEAIRIFYLGSKGIKHLDYLLS